MKKYVTMQCTLCARTRDSIIDIKHFATDKCTITFGCEGRLFPIGYTSDGTILNSVPPTGLTNWYPRGTPSTSLVALNDTPLYDLSTGVKRQFIIAVSNTALGFTPSSSATLTLNLVGEQQVAKDYRQYLYRKTGTFRTVNGAEDGAGKKVLRYDITGSAPDVVDVYVNGVKYPRGISGPSYNLYDGTTTSAVPPNTVLFNTILTGSTTQIDVIVTKASISSTQALTFSRMILDESRTGTGAWEGIDAVKNPATNISYSLFYCDIANLNIAQDIKFNLDLNKPSILHDAFPITLNYSWAIILLSRSKVFTALDRQRAKYAPLSSLMSSANYLVTKYSEGTYQLMITQNALQDAFPPFEVERLNSRTLVKTNLTGNVNAVGLDNNAINGPDA